MRSDAEVAEYFEAARGWDYDRVQAERRSARRAWMIAVAATTVALTAVVAVAALMDSSRRAADMGVVRVVVMVYLAGVRQCGQRE